MGRVSSRVRRRGGIEPDWRYRAGLVFGCFFILQQLIRVFECSAITISNLSARLCAERIIPRLKPERSFLGCWAWSWGPWACSHCVKLSIDVLRSAACLAHSLIHLCRTHRSLFSGWSTKPPQEETAVIVGASTRLCPQWCLQCW